MSVRTIFSGVVRTRRRASPDTVRVWREGRCERKCPCTRVRGRRNEGRGAAEFGWSARVRVWHECRECVCGFVCSREREGRKRSNADACERVPRKRSGAQMFPCGVRSHGRVVRRRSGGGARRRVVDSGVGRERGWAGEKERGREGERGRERERERESSARPRRNVDSTLLGRQPLRRRLLRHLALRGLVALERALRPAGHEVGVGLARVDEPEPFHHLVREPRLLLLRHAGAGSLVTSPACARARVWSVTCAVQGPHPRARRGSLCSQNLESSQAPPSRRLAARK